MSQLIGGRYRLDRELAQGGFGAVWQAFDTVLRVDVAIKEVRIDPRATDAERAKAVARAEHEARNAARLRDHPNIVTIHDVVTDDDVPWLVMRLVTGRSLHRELAERGRLPLPEAERIAGAVLSALAAAHAAGIVHRDVKPANIMLAEDGTVLLTDFGIAKHHTDTAQTTHGMLIGSLPYMSPERLDGRDLPAGDLFALGVTLYEMTDGVSPFVRDTPTATMTAVVLQAPEPPRHAGRLAPLVTALLNKDPDARPDAPTALARLADAARTQGPTQPVPPTTPTPPTLEMGAKGPAPAPATAGVRQGRDLVNELVQQAKGKKKRAKTVRAVLGRMMMEIGGRDFWLAERLIRIIEAADGSPYARVTLAEALWPTDPQQAARLVGAGSLPASLYPTKAVDLAVRIWPIDPTAAERLLRARLTDDEQYCLGLFAAAIAEADPRNAERIAGTISRKDLLATAIAGVAKGTAEVDPERARNQFATAVRLAETVQPESSGWRLRSEAAIAMARSDPHQAEQVVRALILAAQKRRFFAREVMTTVQPIAQVDVLKAMAAVAAEMANSDPAHAAWLAEETYTAHGGVSYKSARDESHVLGHLAVAWAATNRRRANEMAEKAVQANPVNGSLEVLAGILAEGLPEFCVYIACDLIDSDEYRDRVVRELAGRHPQLVTRIREAHPNGEYVLKVARTDPARAVDLARAMSGEDQVFALLELAEMVAAREPALAGRLCDEAEAAFWGTDVPAVGAEILVTAARSATDPDRARTLPPRLAGLAEAAADGFEKDYASLTVAMLIAAFDPDRAEALARAAEDSDYRLNALGFLASVLINDPDPALWKPVTTVGRWQDYEF